VSHSAEYINASEAATRLGVSPKALRLYETHGLVLPVRTAAGWRTYSPDQMSRAREIVALRRLGLSLSQVKSVLSGDTANLERALAAHQASLDHQIRQITDAALEVRALRAELAAGRAPTTADWMQLVTDSKTPLISFDLPWPWGGERFELCHVRPLTYITGPLGCGKTRLAKTIAATLPDAAYLGLERLDDNGAATRSLLDADVALKDRVTRTLGWLLEDGAAETSALIALLVAMETATASVLVVDMVEQGLDQPTQDALSAYLKYKRTDRRPLFLMTRSSSILDLESMGMDEIIIFCPANHSRPVIVGPSVGSQGYDAVATCLASPEVRARTEGVIAFRPQAAAAPLATSRS
jgi:DNA-binding transcriptional MerR regulator